MGKEIIVRKNRAQRLGIICVFMLMLILSLLAIILFYPVYYFGVLSLIGTLPILYILLYYETWQISISSNKITMKCLFKRTKSYSFSQIVDGYIANSYTLHQYVCLLFYDKRRLQFRMEDENAKKALKGIQAHRSIRVLNW